MPFALEASFRMRHYNAVVEANSVCASNSEQCLYFFFYILPFCTESFYMARQSP